MQIRVVLDTNIYRSEPFARSQWFKTLANLCKCGRIKLYLPEVVRREFETHLQKESVDAITNFKTAAATFIKRPLPDGLKDSIDALIKNIELKNDEIAQGSATAFDDWLAEHRVQHLPLTGDQALAAMDAYFKAGKPFKSAKERKDLPDAMIYQSLLQLIDEGPFVLVCGDGRLSESFIGAAGMTVYESLKEFMASEVVLNLILEEEAAKKSTKNSEAHFNVNVGERTDAEVISALTLDTLPKTGQSIKDVIEALKQLSLVASNSLTSHVASHGGENLANSTFNSPSIPSDDREAYIAMFGELENIEFDWEQAAYQGNSIYIVPFQATGVFNISYYVSKWNIEDIERRGGSYSQHNDHVVEADEDAELSVSGALRIAVSGYQAGDHLEDCIDDLDIDSVGRPILIEDISMT